MSKYCKCFQEEVRFFRHFRNSLKVPNSSREKAIFEIYCAVMELFSRKILMVFEILCDREFCFLPFGEARRPMMISKALQVAENLS